MASSENVNVQEGRVNEDETNKKFKRRRNLKDLFGELKNEEKKRSRMEKIEEDELGFVPDKEEPILN